MEASFIGGGNQRTLRKPPTCRKSLTNFMNIYNYIVLIFFIMTSWIYRFVQMYMQKYSNSNLLLCIQ